MRQKQRVFSLFLLSPSSRRAWIEISRRSRSGSRSLVALLAEGVDRNTPAKPFAMLVLTVALLAEGVDRNETTGLNCDTDEMSPSSRRAWIEILRSSWQSYPA